MIQSYKINKKAMRDIIPKTCNKTHNKNTSFK